MSKFSDRFPVFCPRTNETFETYDEYLRGQHWSDVKRRYSESKYKKECFCGAKENLELHHKTYKHLGNEPLSDLTLLCRACHQTVHEILNGPRTNKLNIWSAVKIAENRYRNGKKGKKKPSKQKDIQQPSKANRLLGTRYYSCTSCGHKLRTSEDITGRKILCKCNKGFYK